MPLTIWRHLLLEAKWFKTTDDERGDIHGATSQIRHYDVCTLLKCGLSEMFPKMMIEEYLERSSRD